ncbi:MAG: poly-gamma-glutamate synthase PgsB [Atribacterota bacterium]|nr:poly-gamma-glutamate synthase PgsB [Atribacterota bacterium]
MFILLLLTMSILILGILESYYHEKRIKNIPIRIHVNGIRGKSTTVRLIASILREAGYQVLAKTTGTLPRIILENGEEELIRRRGSANIIEQKYFIQKATERKDNAIVMECMAVHPETQWVSEHKLIHSTIGIITNVREDHQDVYGPNLQEVANSLKLTIPKDSVLVTAEKKFFPCFQKQAEKLNTRCILVDPEMVTLSNKKESKNIFFKDNVAVALQVGKVLNIAESTCWQGILKAKPDPGALAIYKLRVEHSVVWFVNAFAANDRESILLIWDKINRLLPEEIINYPKIAILNNRSDRVTRTIQFARILSKEITVNYILLVGQNSPLSYNQLRKYGYPSDQIILVPDETNINHILEQISRFIAKEGLVYGLGNTRGFGLRVMDYLQEKGEKL